MFQSLQLQVVKFSTMNMSAEKIAVLILYYGLILACNYTVGYLLGILYYYNERNVHLGQTNATSTEKTEDNVSSDDAESSTTDSTYSSSIKLVSIEGNIGSGKSELLKMIRGYFTDNCFDTVYGGVSYLFVDEPVLEWESMCDDNGKSMLTMFYADPERYAFTFQIMAFASRVKYIRKAIVDAEHMLATGEAENVIIIMERSLGCDEHVFAQLLVNNKQMQTVEHNIYKLYASAVAVKSHYPCVTIWVNTEPDVCIANITKRGRAGESNITSKYIHDCDNMHVKWLKPRSSIIEIANFQTINVNSTNTRFIDLVLNGIRMMTQ